MAVEATKRREVAIAQVEEHAAPDVRSLLLKAVRAVAERQPMLTSEDVILAYTGTTPHEPRVLGAVMREAKRQGWIVPTEEWRLSVRPESHRRPQRVWRSLVFGVVA
jgi:DNA-binding IclR family transcriptional regulator